MAAGRFAQGREESCSHFFSILHCKMEKKWTVIFAARTVPRGRPIFSPFYSVKWRKMAVGRFAQGRKGSCSHFFSILQYKMEKKWPSAVQNKMSQKWAPNEGSFWVPGKMSSNWRGRWLKATSPCQKWLVWALKSPKPRI